MLNTWLETVQVSPIDGMDLTATIDIDLQDITEKELLDGVKEFDAAVGAAGAIAVLGERPSITVCAGATMIGVAILIAALSPERAAKKPPQLCFCRINRKANLLCHCPASCAKYQLTPGTNQL